MMHPRKCWVKDSVGQFLHTPDTGQGTCIPTTLDRVPTYPWHWSGYLHTPETGWGTWIPLTLVWIFAYLWGFQGTCIPLTLVWILAYLWGFQGTCIPLTLVWILAYLWGFQGKCIPRTLVWIRSKEENMSNLPGYDSYRDVPSSSAYESFLVLIWYCSGTHLSNLYEALLSMVSWVKLLSGCGCNSETMLSPGKRMFCEKSPCKLVIAVSRETGSSSLPNKIVNRAYKARDDWLNYFYSPWEKFWS